MCRAARRPLAPNAAQDDAGPLGLYGEPLAQAAPPRTDDPVLDGGRFVAVVYVTERYGKSTAIPLHRLPVDAALQIHFDAVGNNHPFIRNHRMPPTYIVGPAAATRIKVEMAPNLLRHIDWRHL